jgi:hypothetical protein
VLFLPPSGFVQQFIQANAALRRGLTRALGLTQPTQNAVSEATRSIIEAHWAAANARDWSAFAQLLAPHLRYEVPQTREYIEGGAGYLDMFCTWPGNWQATVRELVCEESKAVCIINFAVGSESMTGISVFELAAAQIVKVVDYWPEPYEPPPRLSRHMKRAPGEA